MLHVARLASTAPSRGVGFECVTTKFLKGETELDRAVVFGLVLTSCLLLSSHTPVVLQVGCRPDQEGQPNQGKTVIGCGLHLVVVRVQWVGASCTLAFSFTALHGVFYSCPGLLVPHR